MEFKNVARPREKEKKKLERNTVERYALYEDIGMVLNAFKSKSFFFTIDERLG